MSPHHPTKGSGEHCKLPQRGPGRPKIDFMHILGQKEAIWNTVFSIFERRRGPPKRRRARENFPPLSTGLVRRLARHTIGHFRDESFQGQGRSRRSGHGWTTFSAIYYSLIMLHIITFPRSLEINGLLLNIR